MAVTLVFIAAAGRSGKRLFERDIVPVRWFKAAGYLLYQKVTVPCFYHQKKPDESKLYKQMQQMYVKQDIYAEWREYQAQKHALVLAGLLMALAVCSGVFLQQNYWKGRESVNSRLQRPLYGEQAEEYSFHIKTDEGKEDEVQFALEPQIYQKEEVKRHFEAYYEVLKKKVKGENPSLQKVRSRLDFEPDEAWKGIEITWNPSDYSLISDQGEVLLEQAKTGKNNLKLYLTMVHEQYSKTFELPVTIVKYKSDSSGNLGAYLMELQEKNREKAYFELPKEVNGAKIDYTASESDDTAAGIVLLIASIVVLLLYKEQLMIKQQCEKREVQMKADYPEIVSKLLILIRAGMPVRSAWGRMVSEYRVQKKQTGVLHYAFEEMQEAVKEMENGVSEGEAYLNFGKRCEQHLYLKLGSLLEQNLRKGSSGISGLLESERIQALEERRRQVRAAGELAGTKLMMPMIILFGLVLLIIMVPSFLSFGV